MSDSQKQQRLGTTPIKNPLLSASVTGLTFEDFPNKPLLLPAAPPIVHAPSPAPVAAPSGLVGREPKSLVTVGSSSLDTETLDEINLNASNEENQTTDVTDPNANPLLEQSNQGGNSDSILSQAASSFSALPSVASNVFSTFSKRITAISSRETTPIYDQYQQDANANTLAPQLEIQPTYTQSQHQQPYQGQLTQAPLPYYAPPFGASLLSSTSNATSQQATHTNLPQPEPPKFYTPSEVPTIPSASATPSTNLGGQNNFRFSSKKKLYAPIPGLSDQNPKATAALDPSTVSASSYGHQIPKNFNQQPPQYSTTVEENSEERKLSSGLFSKISNLAPAGVLQNITGLVQSAAGSLTQSNKADSHQQSTYADVVFDQQNNYFAGPPPPPTNYFVPPSLSGQNTQHSTLLTGQQPVTSNIINPQSNTQGKTETPNQAGLFSNTPLSSLQTSNNQIPLFNPNNLTPQINPNLQPLRPNRPPSRPPSHPSSSQLPPNPSEQPVGTFIFSNQPNPSQVTFFDPTKYLPTGSQPSAISETSLTSQSLTTTVDPKIPPPASGHTSYRLQKGTKLYKNPLSYQETAPIQVTPNQIQAINQPVNTYSSQQRSNSSQSVPLFAPPHISELTSNQQGVAFFAPALVEESLSNKLAQGVPLLTPAALEELKSKETTQSVPLFTSTSALIAETVPAKSEQSVPLLVKELTSNEKTQNFPLFTPTFAAGSESSKEAQSIPIFATSNEPVQSIPSSTQHLKTLHCEEEINASTAPPIKKQKSNETEQVLADSSVNKILKELKINELDPSAKVLGENITEVSKETIEDPLEATLQKLSLAENSPESKTVKLPPIAESFNFNNPFRRSSTSETAKPTTSLPTLANFFTPEPSHSSVDLNFFTTLPISEPTEANSSSFNLFSETLQNKEISNQNSEPIKTNFFATPELIPLEPDTAVHPPISAFFPTAPSSLGSGSPILQNKNDIATYLNESFAQPAVAPPIGFESFSQLVPPAFAAVDSTTVEQENTILQKETSSQTKQPEVVNRFSNYFNQINLQPEIAKDPSTFFDSFPAQPQQQQQIEVIAASAATNEEQRIQYFFNNPPPKDANAAGDLNYDLVHRGLAVKNIQQRSLTPVSNLVEPPSSTCSEFSEISNSTAGQKSISANLSITDSSDKLVVREETKSSAILEQDSTGEVEDNISRHYKELPEEILKELRMANLLSADKTSSSSAASVSYKPAVKHWFFKRTLGDKHLWIPFSHYDSALLETSLLMEGDDRPNIVAVEGGRYDVNISERKKMSVYWESEPIEVRRCSWFYKAVDSKYVPYEEGTAEVLESEYKQAAEAGIWHKTIILGMGEQVNFHGPTVIVHFQQQQNADAWGGTTQTATRPRVVKRDLDDFNIEQGESQKVDHLLFMVHGIGSACDLKLRSVEEVVEDFRTIARQLVQSHYKNSTDLGLVGRVEVLPISWHSYLHSVEMGIDEKLRMITLESIPKLRNFTNDTLLDILFYTSPTYCQKIMNTIVSSMNTMYLKYRERHPEFNGGVSLAGHSLGSLILFDLLCHQNPIKESEDKNNENPDQFLTATSNNTHMDTNQLEDKQISYTMGPAGTGQPFINYEQLIFQPKKFFALGSPIGVFATIRGIDKLGLDFRLPTCPGFYNIFHPYDPVAYRIEALVNPDLSGIRPVLIPHHKGRKRMHLELKETMTRVSMDLKHRFLDKFKTTLDSVNIFSSTSKATKEAEELMEKEVDKVIQMQMQLEEQNHSETLNDKLPSVSDSQNATPRQRTDSASTAMSDDIVEIDFPLGKLNDSKRIDYVLQEAPLEFINEYIFALSSHVCYWDSEDTILFVMKEIYSGLGISPDSQVPQQTMTIERPSSRNSLLSSS